MYTCRYDAPEKEERAWLNFMLKSFISLSEMSLSDIEKDEKLNDESPLKVSVDWVVPRRGNVMRWMTNTSSDLCYSGDQQKIAKRGRCGGGDDDDDEELVTYHEIGLQNHT